MVDGALGDYNYLFPQIYYFIMVLKQTVNMLDDALQYSQKYQNVLFSTSHDNVLSHLQNLKKSKITPKIMILKSNEVSNKTYASLYHSPVNTNLKLYYVWKTNNVL